MKYIRAVGFVAFGLAVVFIFILGPTSGPGDGPITYWYTGVACAVIGAAAFIVVGALRELSRRSAIGKP